MSGTTTTPAPDNIPKFVLTDGGITCIILQAKLELLVPYFDGKSNQTKPFAVYSNASVTGKCGTDNEIIILQWIPYLSEGKFNLTMDFSKVPRSPSKSEGIIIRNITFQYNLSSKVFPNTNETGVFTVSSNGSFFETPASTGYTCTGQQNITLFGKRDVVFGVSFLHMEAFRNSSSTDFSNKTVDCIVTPGNNSIVPILVGVTAAILIALAITAFVIGNRRRAQGYQSI
ncbi:unnamed protein product [Mesocestoides corti]|uniref:Lysosome-associated membrane glycoprotein 1 n=1 Tax=Mesocestoides corti TaxID=53468 RepID=A0A3P6HEH3_MESCO|nr:unnamed protein product [Mesocestoides corti]